MNWVPGLSRSVRSFQKARVPLPRTGVEVEFPKDQTWVDLEIGCGVGLHPIQYARENPRRTLIAIEHTPSRFQSFARRLAHHAPLPNLLPVHADAIEWVTHRVPLASLSRVFLLYPNPWPRPGDERRRWYAQPFFGHLLECLREEGEIVLATNVTTYAERAALFFEQVWGMREVTLACVEGRGRTHFERKYLARGERCLEVRARVLGLAQTSC